MNRVAPVSPLPAATPVPPRERLALLDALRGFALFGVLVGNLVAYTGYYELAPAARAGQVGDGAADGVVQAIHLLVDGKFYSLFSLLFGLGFALQLERLQAQGGAGVRRYVRRLLVLFGFGLAHLVLLWMGDILALYALLGLVLLLFRHASDRALLGWAAALTLFPVAWEAAKLASGGAFDPWTPFEQASQAVYRALVGPPPDGLVAAWGVADYGVLLRGHLAEIVLRYGMLVDEMRFSKVLALFLLGLWIGRRGIAGALEASRPLLRRVLVAGLLLGVPASLAWNAWMDQALQAPLPNRAMLAAAAGYALGIGPLALAYAAGFALLWRHPRARRLLAVFAPAGRMALTHYLLQTVVAFWLFTGVGLGLVGRVSAAWVPPFAVALFAAQVLASRWWLARFRFGPAEWLWRTLTYGRAQPLRREPEPAPQPAAA